MAPIVLEPYRDLRVSDVCDALDQVGRFDRCLLDPAIRPLFREVQHCSHRIAGPAMTARYLPTQREMPGTMSVDEFDAWVAHWRREYAPSFYKAITPGCVIVIDAADQDVGFIGSNNCLHWRTCGAVGVVTNGGARDTDELIAQHSPVYSRFISRGFKPGRIELESIGRPVNVGGVAIHPGDLMVADGDGVIAVPQNLIEPVLAMARREQANDRQGQASLYAELGLPFDGATP